MARRSQKKKPAAAGRGSNRKRSRKTLQESLRAASNRAHDRANRRIPQRGRHKTIQATIRSAEPVARFEPAEEGAGLLKRAMRWILGAILLPFAWVTMWTLFSRFNHATVHQDFWKTNEFWYFAIGCILLSTWLLSGLLRNFFLYLYVLGHELTHYFFVRLHRGRVSKIHISTTGGYITTDKTNLLIALSPYFVPFYSVWVVLAHLGLRLFGVISDVWDPVFYGLIGATWMFHMIWTIWMLPKDQPDLQENGTFLSLVVILLGNLIVLSALMCAADENPLRSALAFAREWTSTAATFGDLTWRAANHWIETLLAPTT